jgi:hypothetical protein
MLLLTLGSDPECRRAGGHRRGAAARAAID